MNDEEAIERSLVRAKRILVEYDAKLEQVIVSLTDARIGLRIQISGLLFWSFLRRKRLNRQLSKNTLEVGLYSFSQFGSILSQFEEDTLEDEVAGLRSEIKSRLDLKMKGRRYFLKREYSSLLRDALDCLNGL